jgi:GIY-YIG catalytic domain
MRFNTLLREAGIDPTEVAVALHTPPERHLRRVLGALVAEEPHLFQAYQSNHRRRPEATLKARKYLASFVGADRKEMNFAGLFAIDGWSERTAEEFDADPNHLELQARFGTKSFATQAIEESRGSFAEFTLRPVPQMQDLLGRLVISHDPTQSYIRLAENLDPQIVEIRRQSELVPPPPDWREFVLTAQELRTLPQEWGQKLSGWRGVYLITDERDGERYVGSAYGSENLLGRWRAHVAREKGVTVELGQRDPGSFRFSILQLLLHDADAGEVKALEANWKMRLHTRAWGLNRN